MQNRWFTSSVIEETIKNGSHITRKHSNTIAYYNEFNNVTVVLNKEGSVITVSYGVIKQ
jgi:hypothetical protein